MKKELVGYCGVDSGQIILCDPCYIDSQWEKRDFSERERSEGHFSYAGCCNATLSKQRHGQLDFPLGHAGCGVVVSSGYGDGHYPVYAKKNKDGIITEVTIKFME